MKVRFLLTRLNSLNSIQFFSVTKSSINKIKFSFLFVSLISPFVITNMRLILNMNPYYNTNKKIMLKQSYVLLTWFYYLTFLKNTQTLEKKFFFFVLPVRRKTYTLVKAPMAHKNWSKEQYKFQFFLIRVSFSNMFNYEWTLNNVNHALLFILLSKQNFPFFETNIFFLKNYQLYFYIKDAGYFNYYKFLL